MTIRVTDKWKLTKAIGVIFVSMFCIGIAMGSCTLGMKLPYAVFELVTGRPSSP